MTFTDIYSVHLLYLYQPDQNDARITAYHGTKAEIIVRLKRESYKPAITMNISFSICKSRS